MVHRGLRLVLNADSNNSDAFGSCYALLDLTPGLAEACLKRVEAFRRLHAEDEHVRSTYYWDCSPEYFESCDELEALKDAEGEAVTDVLNGEYAILEGGSDESTPKGKAKKFAQKVKGRLFEIPEKARVRTECDQICVDDGVTWMCYPKHHDGVELTTREIPVAVLEKVAGRKITVRGATPSARARETAKA